MAEPRRRAGHCLALISPHYAELATMLAPMPPCRLSPGLFRAAMLAAFPDDRPPMAACRSAARRLRPRSRRRGYYAPPPLFRGVATITLMRVCALMLSAWHLMPRFAESVFASQLMIRLLGAGCISIKITTHCQLFRHAGDDAKWPICDGRNYGGRRRRRLPRRS